MIAAYVDGRPMPRSSSAFTSVASVYRDGGEVEWPSGSRRDASSASPSASFGRSRSSSSGRRLVAALLVGEQEAAERDHGAGRRELGRAPVARGAGDAHRDGLAARVRHLRGDRPLPDQVVDVELVRRQLAAHLVGRAELVAGGADRLVRLLRVLHLARVLARLGRDGLRAVQLARLVAGGGERRLGQRRRVGAHVGDVAVLVEALRDAHRLLRAEPKLAARLLLQRRRHERRRGAARVRLLLDRADA